MTKLENWTRYPEKTSLNFISKILIARTSFNIYMYKYEEGPMVCNAWGLWWAYESVRRWWEHETMMRAWDPWWAWDRDESMRPWWEAWDHDESCTWWEHETTMRSCTWWEHEIMMRAWDDDETMIRAGDRDESCTWWEQETTMRAVRDE